MSVDQSLKSFKRLLLQRLREECCWKGWVLDGAGPARFGWCRLKPAGGREYLGHTAVDAVAYLTRFERQRNDADGNPIYDVNDLYRRLTLQDLHQLWTNGGLKHWASP